MGSGRWKGRGQDPALDRSDGYAAAADKGRQSEAISVLFDVKALQGFTIAGALWNNLNKVSKGTAPDLADSDNSVYMVDESGDVSLPSCGEGEAAAEEEAAAAAAPIGKKPAAAGKSKRPAAADAEADADEVLGVVVAISLAANSPLTHSFQFPLPPSPRSLFPRSPSSCTSSHAPRPSTAPPRGDHAPRRQGGTRGQCGFK